MNLLKASRETRKRLLLFCLLCTLFVHCLALFVFYAHPPRFKNPGASLFPAPSSQPISLDSPRTALTDPRLQEVFNKIILTPPQEQAPYDISVPLLTSEASPAAESLDAASLTAPESRIKEMQLEETTLRIASSTPFVFPEDVAETLLGDIHATNPYPPVSETIGTVASWAGIFSLPPLHLEEVTEDDLYVVLAAEEKQHPITESSTLAPPGISYDMLEKPVLATQLTPFAPKLEQTISSDATASLALTPQPLSDFAETWAVGSMHKSAIVPDIEHYALPGTSLLDWNEDFSVEVKVSGRPRNGKHLFSLTFLPKNAKNLERIKQNVLFCIDRSNTIDRHRYNSFKQAVIRSLRYLHPDDSFNILLLDNRTVRFSKEPVSNSTEALRLADQFLNGQKQAGFFSTPNIFGNLEKIIPTCTENNELYTIMLISDGKTLLKSDKERHAMLQWQQKNKGKLTLHTAAVGQGNDLVTLDLISSLNRGTLTYSDTHASFARKLSKALLDLREPVAKDIVVTPIEAQSDITLYPASTHLPILYASAPYTILGTTDKLEEFSLILQGKHQDKWFNIKKTISLQGAKEGKALLDKHWAVEQSHQRYETFVQKGSKESLAEAATLRKTFPLR